MTLRDPVEVVEEGGRQDDDDHQPPKTTTDTKNKNLGEGEDGGNESEDQSSGGGGTFCNRFNGVLEARGYNMLGIGRGFINMSQLFLSSSLIFLASQEAGCIDDDETSTDETCENRVYGFTPAALVTNIAAITGLLAAFFMPVVGAVLDYTPHRKLVGKGSALFLCTALFVHTATLPATWFYMSILLAIAAFVFQIQIMVTYAYLPYIARYVAKDENQMSTYTSWFLTYQFMFQICFLVFIVAVSAGIGLSTVETAHVSQILAGILVSAIFTYAWGYCMPDIPPPKQLRPGQRLIFASFQENYRTLQNMLKYYRNSLLWFHLALAFGEAGTTALIPVAVTIATETLKMDGSEIGILFFMALVGSIPGASLANFVTQRTNPKRCLNIYFVVAAAVTAGASFMMRPSFKESGYLFGLFWGICFGWYFPTKTLVFSRIIPRAGKKDLEWSGFFVYASQILVWLPPLCFSALVEAGVPTQWGLFALSSFTLIAALCTARMSSWEEVLVETNRPIPELTDGQGQEQENAGGEGPQSTDETNGTKKEQKHGESNVTSPDRTQGTASGETHLESAEESSE